MLRQSTLFLALCLTGAVTTAQAQIYKWTDAQGSVHYSQTKPQKNKDVQIVNSNLGSGSSYRRNNNQETQTKSKSAKKPINKAEEARKKRIKELERNVKKQSQNSKKNKCQALKRNMSALDNGGRIREGDSYLSGKEIDSKRVSVNSQYSSECNGSGPQQF